MRSRVYGAYDTKQQKIVFTSAHYDRVQKVISKNASNLVLVSKWRSF